MPVITRVCPLPVPAVVSIIWPIAMFAAVTTVIVLVEPAVAVSPMSAASVVSANPQPFIKTPHSGAVPPAPEPRRLTVPVQPPPPPPTTGARLSSEPVTSSVSSDSRPGFGCGSSTSTASVPTTGAASVPGVPSTFARMVRFFVR